MGFLIVFVVCSFVLRVPGIRLWFVGFLLWFVFRVFRTLGRLMLFVCFLWGCFVGCRLCALGFRLGCLGVWFVLLVLLGCVLTLRWFLVFLLLLGCVFHQIFWLVRHVFFLLKCFLTCGCLFSLPVVFLVLWCIRSGLGILFLLVFLVGRLGRFGLVLAGSLECLYLGLFCR